MYKLVAVDMDGTLLKNDKTISKNNYSAIQMAKEKGVKVVLATGRPIDGIKRYLNQLNLIGSDDYAVTCNGAVVQNTVENKTLSSESLTYDDLSYLYNLSKKLHANIHAVIMPSCCIAPKATKYSMLEASANKIPFRIVDFSKLDKNITVVKIMFTDEPKALDELMGKFPSKVYDMYTVVRAEQHYVEFCKHGISKGLGIKILAEKLGIKPEEIICIGDAGNDIKMIKYAGLGVAMKNAFPEVKSAADYVTATNEEDGVANVINKFILKQ